MGQADCRMQPPSISRRFVVEELDAPKLLLVRGIWKEPHICVGSRVAVDQVQKPRGLGVRVWPDDLGGPFLYQSGRNSGPRERRAARGVGGRKNDPGDGEGGHGDRYVGAEAARGEVAHGGGAVFGNWDNCLPVAVRFDDPILYTEGFRIAHNLGDSIVDEGQIRANIEQRPRESVYESAESPVRKLVAKLDLAWGESSELRVGGHRGG
ncbi:hypothetical protein C8R45DRAFT_1007011 [Mycena sanguinolenta]|nr:hypothetical protein C8R45DRAFT_1007011 [Mycena sanguinolenta]